MSPHAEEAFSLFLPWVNTDMMNLYLEELSATYPDCELSIIWDQAGWHGSKGLKLPPNIRCEPLPPYSPQLNPTERLWQWLRRHVTRNRLFDDEEERIVTFIAYKRGEWTRKEHYRYDDAGRAVSKEMVHADGRSETLPLPAG